MTILINWTPLFSSSLFASIHNQSPSVTITKSSQSRTLSNSLWQRLFLYTYFFTHNPKATCKRTQQLPTMLRVVGQQSYVRLRGLSDTFMVKNSGFLSCTAKVRPKTAMSTFKRDEQPRHFHMGVPSPSKEQDWDDEHNCLMGYYNKIPNNI